MRHYNKTNICEECKTERLSPHYAKREIKMGKITGRWLCLKCFGLIYNYGTIDQNAIEEIKSDYKKNKQKYYNKTNKCDRCGRKLEIRSSGGGNQKEYKNENWTGKWLCSNCYSKEYNRKYVNFQRREGTLDINSSCYKGDLFEELTCRWRNVRNLNKENDNYNYHIDHSSDIELGTIQTKGKFYDSKNGYWGGGWANEHTKTFDNLIYYCANEKGDMIERIYIFPSDIVKGQVSIGIYKNPSKGTQWYEKYRVKDEETIKKVNNVWHRILEEKGTVNKFKDIMIYNKELYDGCVITE
jgi:hypothetical protein